MARARLVVLLAVRGLRRRRAAAALLLLAVTTATTVLSFAFALGSASEQPWDRTRVLTRGPDVWVRADDADRLAAVADAPGVVLAGPVRPVYRVPDVRSGRGQVGALVEVRDSPEAAVDRPLLVAGGWAAPGGVVVERAFADALGVRPGDDVSVGGRRLRVSGVAVTTARSPYPMNTPGLLWVTTADDAWLGARSPARRSGVALRLSDPSAAPAFAARVTTTDGSVVAWPWQRTREFAVSDQARSAEALHLGGWTLALLAVAGIAVLAGGRSEGRRRRAGLLKAVGAPPRTVAAVLMAEHVLVAVAAAVLGLATGRLVGPLLVRPSGGLADGDVTVTIGAGQAAVVLVLSVVLTCGAALPTVLGAARSGTAAALTAVARPPRRSRRAIALSARAPVPVLVGLRLAARRPRRALLATLSLAVTSAVVVAALAMQYSTDRYGARDPVGGDFVPGARNPVMDRLDEVTVTVMIALVVLAAMNTLLIGWAGVLDFRRGTALLRALGADARQVTAGIVVANLVPSAVGGVLGVPLGLGFFELAARLSGVRHDLVLPPPSGLWPVPVGVVAVVAGLMTWPARAGARRPVAQVLAGE